MNDQYSPDVCEKLALGNLAFQVLVGAAILWRCGGIHGIKGWIDELAPLTVTQRKIHELGSRYADPRDGPASEEGHRCLCAIHGWLQEVQRMGRRKWQVDACARLWLLALGFSVSIWAVSTLRGPQEWIHWTLIGCVLCSVLEVVLGFELFWLWFNTPPGSKVKRIASISPIARPVDNPEPVVSQVAGRHLTD